MKEIIQYIDELDKNGNYRLADKIENDVKKVYAQAMQTIPGQGNQMLNPNFAFILNQLLMKEQAKMTQKKETDTLSPAKNTDINTLRKQVNKIIADGIISQKKMKNFETSLGALPGLEGKVGKVSEMNDEFNTKITDNSNKIQNNTEDIALIKEQVDTLE